ncbi:hypothetical protein, partial [Streptomyces decoyicus]|uniref:hypothetical protein n=1 Tax=Streptomyces decoyicus TaxID=249567 RepID=UPI0033ACB203
RRRQNPFLCGPGIDNATRITAAQVDAISLAGYRAVGRIRTHLCPPAGRRHPGGAEGEQVWEIARAYLAA